MYLPVALLAFCLCASAYGALMPQLPGAPAVSFRQYAGYFDVGENKGHHLHYWFTESQADPANDPLLLFLYGGPGCSGMAASLTEWGPYRLNSDGKTLQINEFSWNNNANVLILEAPAGVGYSYTDDGNVATNDDKTAEENWEALCEFFKKFSEFHPNDFYITGESYAGIYVPTLADVILKRQNVFQMNLKGLFIGNGLTSQKLNIDTTMQFEYDHGMVSESLWQRAKYECCNQDTDGCAFHSFTGTGFCASFVKNVTMNVWTSGVNPYDIYDSCSGEAAQKATLSQRFQVDHFHATGLPAPAHLEVVNCIDEHAVNAYLNIPAVRKAFFVSTKVGDYESCSLDVTTHYTKQSQEMGSIIKNAIASGVRVYLYHGDVDSACNFMMGQRFSATLGVAKVSNKQEYYVNGQIGGYYTAYNGLEFATVRGAGHVVPAYKPDVALHILSRYLKGQSPV